MTVSGNEVSYNGGRFKLVCVVNNTNSAVKFIAKLKVTDDFRSQHSAKLEYINTKGNWKTIDTIKHVKGKDTYKLNGGKYFSNTDYSTKVRVTIGGHHSTVTLTSNIKPAKPTITKVELVGGHFEITVQVNKKGSAVPSNTLHLYHKEDVTANAWDEIGAGTSLGGITSKTIKTLWDQTVSNEHRYEYAASVENQAGDSGKTIWDGWMYRDPPQVTNVNVTKISDTKAEISYEISQAETTDRRLISQVVLERRTNNGKWDVRKTVNIERGEYGTKTINDTITPNNYYSYRITTKNPQRTGQPTEPTEEIYTSPFAPTFQAYYTSSGNVDIKIDNSKVYTAEETQIQRSTDNGSSWSDIDTITSTQTSYTDIAVPVGVDILYRLRNLRDNGALYSDWNTMTTPVLVLITPNPPTLLSPFNDAKLEVAESVRLTWMHNPLDGTPQRNARIKKYVNGTNVGTTAIGTNSYYDLDISTYNPSDVIGWQVATRGESNTYSDYSDLYEFTIYAPPTLTINQPSNNATIDSLPLHFDMDYADDSGTLNTLTLEIRQNQHTIYRVDLPTDTPHIEYDLDYLFENNQSYDIVITAQSTSGLSTYQIVPINVDYAIIGFAYPWYPDAEIDTDTGKVTVTINQGENEMVADPDDPTTYVNEPIVRAVLYRNTAQGKVKIADTINQGEQYVDLYAPLNQEYSYDLLQVSSTGKISVLSQSLIIDTPYWYVYWGDDQICRALWNPNGDVQLSRPEKELIRYSGREYPVSYDSSAMNETFSFSGIITDRAELNNFIAMIRNGGTGIWHSANGESYDASFDFDYSADYTNNEIFWTCKLNVTRIAQ